VLWAAVAATVLLGSCSRSDGVSPGQVQKFLVVKEVTDNFTRLIQFVGTAEQGIQTLSQQKPGTAKARGYLSGAKTGWQNVLVETTNFTPTQAKAIPGLADAVVATHEAATQWLLALNAVSEPIRDGSVSSFDALRGKFARAREAETRARAALQTTALSLARTACSLETANAGLASSGAATSDCTSASKLASAGS